MTCWELKSFSINSDLFHFHKEVPHSRNSPSSTGSETSPGPTYNGESVNSNPVSLTQNAGKVPKTPSRATTITFINNVNTLYSCFSLTIKDVDSYTKLSIYKAKNRSDHSTTNSALQLLENSGFRSHVVHLWTKKTYIHPA